MTTLHLGVIEIPYAYNEPRTTGRGKKRQLKSSTSMTTGDVAEILEQKYHIAEIFYEDHAEQIGKALEESMAGALESAMMGSPRNDPFGAGTQKIDEMFRDFILSGAAERAVPGAPTKAAMRGVSHRLAHPYAKDNPRRVSFRDTGLYVDHFTSWVEHGDSG